LRDSSMTGRGWLRWIGLAAALTILDASLTFHNIWPTPLIRWTGELSVELAACVLMLILVTRSIGSPSRTWLAGLSVAWVFLVIGRYAEVTAPALFGRDINLYWELQYIPAVVALLAQAAPVWLIVVAVSVTLATLGALYALARWALGRVASATGGPPEGRALTVIAVAAIALFIGQQLSVRVPRIPAFATPVVQTYAHQVRLVGEALAGSKSLLVSPSMSSDLARVKGADVLLIFLESYGASAFERPELAAGLTAGRASLDAAIHASRRDVLSAYVESPTFGGSSWLAHVSLMSGVEIRDPESNALLMTQKRDTLVTFFSRHGYRTVALMPGLWMEWPEGTYYGFDEIYGGVRLAYPGPPFGWFDIPDQFALAKLDSLEMSRQPRAPLFVVFPTISTHTPFRPTPPYQPDWGRMLTDQPYTLEEMNRAFDREPDWMDLAPSYVDAMSYTYETLAGFLRGHADRDFVLILLGDHQPPALVSGEGASWDVPVHVITSRQSILERLPALGFRAGLTPQRPAIGRLHELRGMLLDAFGDRETTTHSGP
jgi:Sulfatase